MLYRGRRRTIGRDPEPQQRDLEILRALYRYRYLTTRQIADTWWPDCHLTRAQVRLRRMHDAGWVDRLRPRLERGSHEWIYYLARKGFALGQSYVRGDQALWAFGFYEGLRRGELAALRLEDVDLDEGVIRVRYGWDRLEGLIDLKSKAGRRDLPLCGLARRYLMAHLVRSGRREGFVFGRASTTPFTLDVPGKRAAKIWRRSGLEPIGLHEAHHTFASPMIASMAEAGRFNAKVLQELMGHASITETFDRYGHLFPGTKDEAVGLLDAYLERAGTGAPS